MEMFTQRQAKLLLWLPYYSAWKWYYHVFGGEAIRESVRVVDELQDIFLHGLKH